MSKPSAVSVTYLVLGFLTFPVLTSQPSGDVQPLIYTLQQQYCGKHFCSLDSSYKPPVCNEQSSPDLFTNTTVRVPSTPRRQHTPPCLNCSCSDNCVIYGTCCADKYIGGQYFFDCEEISLTRPQGHRKTYRRMVTKCLPDAPSYSHDLAEKCEHGELGYIEDGRLVMAPHPFNTNVTFRNKYCAMCYDITNYMPWGVYITCTHDLDSSHHTDMNALIRSVKESQSGSCYISTFLGNNPVDLSSDCPWGVTIISTCNVTGEWQHYNRSIEKACQYYMDPALGYRNIFCALCNGLQEEELACRFLPISSPAATGAIMPFSAILNFDSSDVEVLRGADPSYRFRRIGKQEEHQCREGDVYDAISRKCREKYCTLIKSLDNKTCVELVPREDYVVTTWKLTVYYTDDIVMAYGTYSSSVSSNVIHKLKDLIENCGFIISTKTFRDYAYIHSQHELIIKESQLTLGLRLLANSSLKSSRQRLDDIKTLSLNITWGKQTIGIQVIPVRSLRNITDMLLVPSVTPLFAPPRKNDSEMNKDVTVPLAFNLSCLLFRFDSYEVEHKHSSVIIHGNTVLDEHEYFVKDNKYYFICSDVVFWTKKAGNTTSYLSAEQIVTVICLSCSLLFLFLTLIIYIFIKELHNIPGLNLILLTSSLFVAQALYLFGAGANKNPTICTTFGILLHYFWLVAFAWMNVSCLHMFRVFTNVFKTLDFAGNERYVVLKYAALAFGVPLVIVCITISASYITSDHTSFGYGGSSLCFVSSGVVSVLAFGVPAGFTVITNTVLLIYTMMSLRRAETEQDKSAPNDIFTFFKLSTITGLSWLFGFLGYFFRRIELMYVFTSLSAGQGVFIFISFAVSRRILKMVRNKARCPQKQSNKLQQFSDITCGKNQTTSNALPPGQSTTSRL